MGFKPVLIGEEQEKCDITWRVVQGSCWVSYKDYFFYPGGVAMIYKPCDSVDCCSIGLKVCRFILNGKTYISIDTISGANSNNCIGITQAVYDPFSLPIVNPDGSISYNYYKELPCQSRCNWLYSLTDSIYFSKQVSQLDLFEGSYSNDSINYDISLTSNETNIHLTILSRLISKNVKISISNLRGENILNKDATLNKGINQLEIPTNNLLTGIYFLSINIDGILYKTEKITILR